MWRSLTTGNCPSLPHWGPERVVLYELRSPEVKRNDDYSIIALQVYNLLLEHQSSDSNLYYGNVYII